ncbi:MAG: OB-fold nucleic acid binding domain-containing protein [Bacteroidales bacterium]|nr:OB-fold nucleic acid binding domain-containing protein [Bacteroidales bacterium]
MKQTLFFLFLLLFATLVVSASCGHHETGGSRSHSIATPIGKITDNPGAYNDQIVTVKGTVSNSTGLFNTCSFRLRDHSGDILVYCPSTMAPRNGEVVRISGTVHLLYRFGGSSLCYIKQTKKQ